MQAATLMSSILTAPPSWLLRLANSVMPSPSFLRARPSPSIRPTTAKASSFAWRTSLSVRMNLQPTSEEVRSVVVIPMSAVAVMSTPSVRAAKVACATLGTVTVFAPCGSGNFSNSWITGALCSAVYRALVRMMFCAFSRFPVVAVWIAIVCPLHYAEFLSPRSRYLAVGVVSACLVDVITTATLRGQVGVVLRLGPLFGGDVVQRGCPPVGSRLLHVRVVLGTGNVARLNGGFRQPLQEVGRKARISTALSHTVDTPHELKDQGLVLNGKPHLSQKPVSSLLVTLSMKIEPRKDLRALTGIEVAVSNALLYQVSEGLHFLKNPHRSLCGLR